MTSFIILFVILLFILAYRFYGGRLQRRWGVDPSRPTPAHTLRDDLDYVPTLRCQFFRQSFYLNFK